MSTFSATAHTNIALIKYWGKSADEGNLPATGSLSLTLDHFYTSTSVEQVNASQDSFFLNGSPSDEKSTRRVIAHIDFMRALANRKERFVIRSINHVPTRAGLASSASGFAALTLALAQALDLNASVKDLTKIARRGSGSAARSLFGGFALMHGGPEINDEQAFAEGIKAPLEKSVRLIVVECDEGEKPIGSREAMRETSRSSIFYAPFLANHQNLLKQAQIALEHGDIEALGSCMEQSTLQMHATMLGCPQPFWYFNPVTVAVMNEVKALRRRGMCSYFTMDAGPHVKVLCTDQDANHIANHLCSIAGVSQLTICATGPAAYAHD